METTCFMSKSVHNVTFQLTFCDNSVITVVALKSNSRGQLSSVDTSDSRLSQPLFVRWWRTIYFQVRLFWKLSTPAQSFQTGLHHTEKPPFMSELAKQLESKVKTVWEDELNGLQCFVLQSPVRAWKSKRLVSRLTEQIKVFFLPKLPIPFSRPWDRSQRRTGWMLVSEKVRVTPSAPSSLTSRRR